MSKANALKRHGGRNASTIKSAMPKALPNVIRHSFMKESPVNNG